MAGPDFSFENTKFTVIFRKLNTDGLKFLKNHAIQGDSREYIIFVKFQYPEVFNSFKDF